MSDNFGANEEFEKIEAYREQDDGITSTSLTGESPEEDRYSGSPAQNKTDADLLGDFLSGGPASSDATPDPLIAFESSSPEPFVTESTPTQQTADIVSGVTPSNQAEGCWMKTVDPRVLELIYWRDVKKTGVVFGSMMFMVLSLAFFTILSVLSYLSLAILTVTLSFRVYKNVMQAVQKTNEGHPFKTLLDLDIDLKEDVVQSAADKIATNVNNCHRELRRLFLIEDYVDSLKFGLLLWLMTYVGCCFNGMTLVILAVVSIFTLPKVYETYQGPIDQNVNLVRGQLNNIMAQVSSKIPFPKKKAKTQ